MTNELTTKSNQELAISNAQYDVLTQSTPSEEIRLRKGRGNRQFPYTDPAYVIRTLNMAFGWDWDFEADNEEIFYANSRPFEAKVRGRLTVRNGDKVIVKTQFGCQPIEYLTNEPDTPVSLGDAFKGAASDALKKCASLLGVALDLYDSDSDINRGKKPQQVQQQAGTKSPQPTAVQGSKAGNGGRVATDPMSQFWLAVKQNELSEAEGKRILSSVGGDSTKALAALQGISQDSPIAA